MSCLAKDPSLRPQNAEELLRLLGRIRVNGAWDNDTARSWWETHLVELTGPLNAAEPGAAGDPTWRSTRKAHSNSQAETRAVFSV
jgi:hypothetical protein